MVAHDILYSTGLLARLSLHDRETNLAFDLVTISSWLFLVAGEFFWARKWFLACQQPMSSGCCIFFAPSYLDGRAGNQVSPETTNSPACKTRAQLLAPLLEPADGQDTHLPAWLAVSIRKARTRAAHDLFAFVEGPYIVVWCVGRGILWPPIQLGRTHEDQRHILAAPSLCLFAQWKPHVHGWTL